ncbi:MAG: Multiphosphoryl transfer protein [Lentisphaerae bacterium ADurb.Bin242]|nr:MAG: Multiphosphoryl transfer protein [Lentisphaerae bacterium ADurb.Bin242]
MSKTTSGIFEIINERGFHARPASLFVQQACVFDSKITVRNEATGDHADGKSLMSLLMLAAARGTKLTIVAEGTDAEEALQFLGEMIAKGFDEE